MAAALIIGILQHEEMANELEGDIDVSLTQHDDLLAALTTYMLLCCGSAHNTAIFAQKYSSSALYCKHCIVAINRDSVSDSGKWLTTA